MISTIFVDDSKSEVYLGKLNGTVIVEKELNFFKSSVDIL
jgi:hypothetical protein